MRIAVPFLSVLLLAAAAVQAQEAVTLPHGARVRVTAPASYPAPLVGTLLEARDTAIVIEAERVGAMTIPHDSVTRFEWSRGRRSHAAKGALIGAAVLGGTAVVLPIAYGSCWDGDAADGECLAGSLVIGAIVGLLPGALIGSLVRWDDWAETPVARVRLSVGTDRDRGLRVGFAMRR